MQKRINPDLEVKKPLFFEVDGFDGSKRQQKYKLITTDELLDEVGKEAEQFNLPHPNLAEEDTYGSGREDEVRGHREDGVREVTTAKRFVSGVDAS